MLSIRAAQAAEALESARALVDAKMARESAFEELAEMRERVAGIAAAEAEAEAAAEAAAEAEAAAAEAEVEPAAAAAETMKAEATKVAVESKAFGEAEAEALAEPASGDDTLWPWLRLQAEVAPGAAPGAASSPRSDAVHEHRGVGAGAGGFGGGGSAVPSPRDQSEAAQEAVAADAAGAALNAQADAQADAQAEAAVRAQAQAKAAMEEAEAKAAKGREVASRSAQRDRELGRLSIAELRSMLTDPAPSTSTMPSHVASPYQPASTSAQPTPSTHLERGATAPTPAPTTTPTTTLTTASTMAPFEHREAPVWRGLDGMGSPPPADERGRHGGEAPPAAVAVGVPVVLYGKDPAAAVSESAAAPAAATAAATMAASPRAPHVPNTARVGGARVRRLRELRGQRAAPLRAADEETSGLAAVAAAVLEAKGEPCDASHCTTLAPPPFACPSLAPRRFD